MDRPSRRRFLQGSLALAGLGLLAGCGVLPPQAQPPPKLPRVGVLLPYAADSAPSREMLEPFRAGLQELGYVEGQNIGLEYRFSGGENERFPELVAELIRLPVDVIVAEKHDAILAAKQATSTIPIVMSVSRHTPSGNSLSPGPFRPVRLAKMGRRGVRPGRLLALECARRHGRPSRSSPIREHP